MRRCLSGRIGLQQPNGNIRQQEKRDYTKTYGASADDHCSLASTDSRPRDGVAAYGQRLDQGQLVKREGATVQLSRR